jgi:hypothetical protein
MKNNINRILEILFPTGLGKFFLLFCAGIALILARCPMTAEESGKKTEPKITQKTTTTGTLEVINGVIDSLKANRTTLLLDNPKKYFRDSVLAEQKKWDIQHN